MLILSGVSQQQVDGAPPTLVQNGVVFVSAAHVIAVVQWAGEHAQVVPVNGPVIHVWESPTEVIEKIGRLMRKASLAGIHS